MKNGLIWFAPGNSRSSEIVFTSNAIGQNHKLQKIKNKEHKQKQDKR